MYIDTERKYSPKVIGDLIFPNAHVEGVVRAYASGEVTRPLILSGRNGTGKSLIASLIPKAIEGIEKPILNRVKAQDLNSNKEVLDKFTKNKMFDKFFTTNGQRFSYNIIEEVNFCPKARDAFRVVLDDYRGTDLTIITTNEVVQIDKGIKSRCEILEVPALTPSAFFPYAKSIMAKEKVDISDAALLSALEAAYEDVPDNREYYKTLDSLFRQFHELQQAKAKLLTKLS